MALNTANCQLIVNCNSTSLVDSTKKSSKDDGIEHSILPVNCNGIGSTDTEESSPGHEIGRGKPTLEYKAPEETVAADGFVAIKRKEKPKEESKKNKIPKPPKGREQATLQENHSILEQKVSVQGRTRSPLADRANVSDVAGKPYVGPPLKQLRLEQWVRRVD